MMSGAAHLDPSNRKVALLISVLATLLAFSETLGKSSQTEALSRNIEAANLWSFFQAKTIRMTTVRTAVEGAELQLQSASGESKQALTKRIDDWRKTAARYDTEPDTGEGRKELAQRAKLAEAKRDQSLAAYHQYETASAALQIAIVLASAEVITGAGFLLWAAMGLGVVGLLFTVIGFVAPNLVHLF
jgi:hypothetical protein